MGGRPRLPTAVAKATGAAAKNPGRHSGRATPKVDPLGPPPEHLNAGEKKAWNMFAKELPWLGASDRVILEGAARIRAGMVEAMPSMGTLTELRQILNALGATPAARSKVNAPADDEDDPLDQFVN